MIKIYFTLLSTVLFASNVFGQQIPYYKATDLELGYQWNPGMTAVWDQAETTLQYRQQWAGFEGAPLTISAGFQYPFINNKMAAGIFIDLDQVGPLQSYDIGLSYAYRLHTGITYDDQLSIGLLGKMSWFQLNPEMVFAVDTDDSFLVNSGLNQKPQANFGVGLFYTSTSSTKYTNSYLFAGLAANQLLRNDLVFSDTTGSFQREIHANGIIGYRINNTDNYIEPSIRVEYAAPNVVLITGGLLFEYDQLFWAGVHYSTDSNLHISLGGIIKDQFLDGDLRIGLRGGYNIGSDLATEQGLTYEVFIGHIFEFY